MTSQSFLPLAGIGVLVTRPAHQADGMAQRVTAMGGSAVRFPALAIEPVAVPPLDLAGVDIAIFVSPNAAMSAAPHIVAAGGLPPEVRVAALGAATSAQIEKSALRRPGGAPVILPLGGFDSEALLEHLPASEVAGRRVLIFRGEGGRELLGQVLRSRGAAVNYVETYRRVRPDADPSALAAHWKSGRVGATLANSAEIVANLFQMAGPAAESLRRTPMFVPHPRVAAAAFRHGVQSLVVAGNGDEALAAGLATWFGRLRPEPNPQPRT